MARTDPVGRAEAMLVGPPPTAAAVRSILGQIADELDAVNARQAALWRARRIAYGAGRVLDPPLTLVDLAAAARASQPQVHKALGRPVPESS